MDKLLKEKMTSRFNLEEIEKIEAFLDRGFSPNGVIVILSIFFCAADENKKLADVMPACEKAWENVWQMQHPDLRGDVDAPGGAGAASRRAIGEIYEKVGIASPMKDVVTIPQAPFTVRTWNSTYKFGAIDEEGWRTIERLNKPIDISRCKITFLALHKSMKMDDDQNSGWTTSPVVTVE